VEINMIIGIAGQHSNGKGIVATYLTDKLNKLYRIAWYHVGFADNVKRIFCETFKVNREFIEEWKRKDESPPGFQMSVRQGLIFIGDGFRKIQSNIWIDLLLKNNTKNLIISDVRYVNEFNYIRNNAGITMLLWRPNHENDLPNGSEQQVMQFVNMLKNVPDGLIKNKDIPFDVCIKNEGTINDLYEKINNIIIPLIKIKHVSS
jgi:hypothetical protein